jgi:hypothetical protein
MEWIEGNIKTCQPDSQKLISLKISESTVICIYFVDSQLCFFLCSQ